VDGPAGFGKALRFPGTAPSPFVSTGRWDPSANTDRLTVAVWIKWEGPTAYYQGIVSKRDAWSATDTCWGLSLDQATGNITFSRYNCYPSFGTHIPPLNEWQEIVVTFDGGTAILYTNGQTSSLIITGLCSAGTLRFAYKTSTEPADKLAFYLDEQKMGEWSGEMRWTQAGYPLAAGTHTFEWRYVKNASGASGQDTVWIDEVKFPAP
jgi:hypothetical protein